MAGLRIGPEFSAQQAGNDEGGERAEKVDGKEYERLFPRAFVFMQQQWDNEEIDRQSGRATHPGGDEDGDESFFCGIDGAGGHDARDGAGEGAEERQEGFSAEAGFGHHSVHEKCGAGHVAGAFQQADEEKEQVEKLLLNIMPRAVYEEFKMFGVVTPQLYDTVSVLTLDFVGFTEMVASADPSVTVTELNDIYSAFDRIGEQFGCERIKTIGDAYITVAGLPDPAPDHGSAAANVAIRFIRYLERRNKSHPNQWRCRIGLASGSVVGSVIGIQKYVYDIFGPAVNLASRLQEFSDPMQISVQHDLALTLKSQFEIESLGNRDIRGFSQQEVWRLVDGKKLPA